MDGSMDPWIHGSMGEKVRTSNTESPSLKQGSDACRFSRFSHTTLDAGFVVEYNLPYGLANYERRRGIQPVLDDVVAEEERSCSEIRRKAILM